MAIDFLALLSEKKSLVWPAIAGYLDRLTDFPSYCAIGRHYAKMADFHQKLVADYPQRQGKYLRPGLVLLVAAAMGFPEKKALLTAAAMQVSEDWILNHDDFEDDSRERRGQPALHRIYGPALAVNAGDALHVLMWQILTDNMKKLGPERGQKILNEFGVMLGRTTLGQTAEIKWTLENRLNLTEQDVFFILESKTAYYTIAGPMRLGAILAGATERELQAIYEFGRPLGRCFQIKDDLLDLTSDFAGLKKQTGNDVYEGKRTIMLIHLLAKVKSQDKEKLRRILAKPREEKTEAEVKWVIRQMEKYGSLDHGYKLADRLAQEAKEAFQAKLGFLRHQPARSQIEAGIDFIVHRDR